MPRRILEGNVVSDKQEKTVTVQIERRFMHPVYKKYVKKTVKYAAHDQSNAFGLGDKVQIEECRPISKRKTWRVITTPPETSHKGQSEEESALREEEAKASRPDTKKKSAAKAEEPSDAAAEAPAEAAEENKTEENKEEETKGSKE